MNILITDYYCASNRGDAAILEGVIAGIKKYFPNAEITVMTNYPNSARFINQIDTVKQSLVPFRCASFKKNISFFYILIGTVFGRFGIVFPWMKTIEKRLSLEKYMEADFIVSTGGSFLNDFYAPANIGRLFGLYFAKLLKRPVILYAQSIGPLNKTLYRQITKYILNKVDLIILRDSKSKEILDSVGIKKPFIYITADAAFTMPLITTKKMQPLRHENILPLSKKKDRLRISISVREWNYSVCDNKQYIKVIAALADWLIAKKNADIIFVSTCTGLDGYYYDDRIVACKIINCMRKKYHRENNPVVLYGEYMPQELSTIYGSMDLHIGTRMHSNIFAILAKTPVVAIQYEFKTSELMKLFELDDYVINMDNIEIEHLKKKVNKALTNLEQLKDQINVKLPGIKCKSEYSAKLIFDLIKNKKLKQ